MKKLKKTLSLQAKKGKRTTSKDVSIYERNITIILALFAFILYANTLGHGYVIDDDLAIALNSNVQQGFNGIFDIFNQPYRNECFGGCLYRPVTLTTFAIEWAIAPNSPFIGHLMNVIWYSATAGLLFITIRRFIPTYPILFPFVAVILFTAHPIHTEVVANIKSRDEILSLFFIILSFHQFARWHETRRWITLLLAGFAFFAALLSKEGAVSVFPVFALVGWIFFNKSFGASIKNSWWAVLPVVLFFLLRNAAFIGLTEPTIHMNDNPIVNAQGSEFLGTAFVVLLKYLMLLVVPLQLQSDYSYNVIPLYSLGSIYSLAGLIIYVALSAYAVYGVLRRSVTGFSTAAFLFSIALYSHIPKVIGTMMAERLMYTPSLWFVLGLTALLAFLLKVDHTAPLQFRWKELKPAHRNMLIACTCITLLYSFQTLKRNGDWASNFRLYKADVAKAPNSVRLNDWYAEELYISSLDTNLLASEVDTILKKSEDHSLKSLSIKAGVAAYNNLGNVSFTRGNYEQAVYYYDKALGIVENYKIAKRNMTSTLLMWAREEGEKNNNQTRARELLQKALQYDDRSSEVWHLIGITYGIRGNYVEALKAFEKAYSLAPNDQRIKQDLYQTYLNLGMQDKAENLK